MSMLLVSPVLASTNSVVKPGGVVITGDDPDYHGVVGPNASGANRFLRKMVSYVTYGKVNPKILLVTDLRHPGGDQVDSVKGLEAAGFSTFDIADSLGVDPRAINLNNVNFNNYDVIIVASDSGGWLRQDELDILNNRSNDLLAFINNGGGLVALNESGRPMVNGANHPGTQTGRFGFLPFMKDKIAVYNKQEITIGIPEENVLGLDPLSDIILNIGHIKFTTTANMFVTHYDTYGTTTTDDDAILGLAMRGRVVTPSGFDFTPPEVSLQGDTSLVIEANTLFVDSGVKAIDNCDGDISNLAIISGTVDTSKPGTYTLKYNVSDRSGNLASELERTVKVIDTKAPVITLNGTSEVALEVGSNYEESGTSAIDNIDGNITSNLVASGEVDTTKLGTYMIKYNVSDSSGNKAAEVVRTVKVVDTTAPIISLQGDQTINLIVGGKYSEPGAVASDNYDGNLTEKVVISGTVDTQKVGSYVLKYVVIDTSGNWSTELARTVIVQYQFSISTKQLPLRINSGRTLPIKFQIVDVSGSPISNATAKAYVVSFNGIEQEAQSTSASVRNNLFRYDPIDQQYIFNLNTKGMSVGEWKILIKLEDLTTHSLPLTIER